VNADKGDEVKSKRIARAGAKPARRLFVIAGAAATLAAAPVFLPSPAFAAAVANVGRGQDVDDFYDAQGDGILWLRPGQSQIAARQLLSLIETADVDGLDSDKYKPKAIAKALDKAQDGDRGHVRRADEMLSKAFVAYARDLRNAPLGEMKYIDPLLHPGPPSPRALLEMAASAPSLDKFIADMGWMNPNYAPLRRALLANRDGDTRKQAILKLNLARARSLGAGLPRYIVINAAAQRLYMYENGKLADSMKVVVGQSQQDRKTPMMAGYLRYASLNPYWNVPIDLVWDDVGIYVEKYSLGYLKSRGYQVLSDWSENPAIVDPSTIDWQAVKDGTLQIRVRQLPGPHNVLGKVKYTFTNPFGVYLHDTSAKELLDKDVRLFSGGCIRLEDAQRLGRWLYGRTLTATSDAPDIKVPLDDPVPVYVTYMTAVPNGSSITYLDDVYGWDEQRLAQLGTGGGQVATR
jgi:murein L,D-transpeptidase YcbB/YkuD